MSSNGRFPNSSGAVARGIVAMTLAMLVLSPAIAEAGFITIDPAGMNAIFMQPSFGGSPIDIRFNPPLQIVDPALLDINNPAQLTALFDLAPDPAPTVDAFFVDQISDCGVYGCAQLPGHLLVEESEAVSRPPTSG